VWRLLEAKNTPRRPKTPLGGQKWHEGVDLLKKVFDKSFSTTSKNP
jgi:hypothetical protein